MTLARNVQVNQTMIKRPHFWSIPSQMYQTIPMNWLKTPYSSTMRVSYGVSLWTFGIKLQLGAIIMQSNITWFCIHHWGDGSRIWIKIWTHITHPLPHPYRRDMGCLLWGFWRKLTVLWQHGSVLLWGNEICKIPIRLWTYKSHPIARPHGRAMVCLLWVHVFWRKMTTMKRFECIKQWSYPSWP